MKIIHAKRINSAFSLVELLIVVAIVGLLAAIAIPLYRGHLFKAKANALWNSSDPAKLYVESRYFKQNLNPSSINVDSGTAEYTAPSKDFIKCITIQDGIVTVLGKASEFGNQTVWVSWVPTVSSGSLNWACTYSSDAAQYMSESSTNCSVGTAHYSTDAGCN